MPMNGTSAVEVSVKIVILQTAIGKSLEKKMLRKNSIKITKTNKIILNKRGSNEKNNICYCGDINWNSIYST